MNPNGIPIDFELLAKLMLLPNPRQPFPYLAQLPTYPIPQYPSFPPVFPPPDPELFRKIISGVMQSTYTENMKKQYVINYHRWLIQQQLVTELQKMVPKTQAGDQQKQQQQQVPVPVKNIKKQHRDVAGGPQNPIDVEKEHGNVAGSSQNPIDVESEHRVGGSQNPINLE